MRPSGGPAIRAPSIARACRRAGIRNGAEHPAVFRRERVSGSARYLEEKITELTKESSTQESAALLLQTAYNDDPRKLGLLSGTTDVLALRLDTRPARLPRHARPAGMMAVYPSSGRSERLMRVTIPSQARATSCG
jgi:hypothetical protein